MPDDREKVTRFRGIYTKQMLTKEGVSRVLYLGTTEEPKWEHGVLKEWESGRSDLDIKVYGDGIIPGRVKIEGVLLIERLNYELNLRLEDFYFIRIDPVSPTNVLKGAFDSATILLPEGATECVKQRS